MRIKSQFSKNTNLTHKLESELIRKRDIQSKSTIINKMKNLKSDQSNQLVQYEVSEENIFSEKFHKDTARSNQNKQD